MLSHLIKNPPKKVHTKWDQFHSFSFLFIKFPHRHIFLSPISISHQSLVASVRFKIQMKKHPPHDSLPNTHSLCPKHRYFSFRQLALTTLTYLLIVASRHNNCSQRIRDSDEHTTYIVIWNNETDGSVYVTSLGGLFASMKTHLPATTRRFPLLYVEFSRNLIPPITREISTIETFELLPVYRVIQREKIWLAIEPLIGTRKLDKASIRISVFVMPCHEETNYEYRTIWCIRRISSIT